MTNEFSKASFNENNEGISLGERLASKFKNIISWENKKETETRIKKNTVKKNIKKPEEQAPFKILPGEKPVRIMSLMGLEQVGQCLIIEYENDMIMIDAGMEFAADEDVLWADYIIPDISYVKENLHKLRGILLTHGHLDHIWALKDILPELNRPTIYTTPLTLGIVKKSFQNREQMNKIKYKIINPDIDIVKLGVFTIEFVHVNHNIPETMAMAIHTPKGLIFNTADFKVDFTPAIDRPADLSKIARIGNEWVKLYIWDSLWTASRWEAKSEKEIWENLEKTIKNIDGRVIVATFASNVGRIVQLINAAVRNNRVVFLAGRSMVNNVEICQELGYIKVPKAMVRKLDDDVEQMPDERVMIICTGAQWEEFSALARMARDEHPQIKLRKWDTIMMSSSIIPGNELQAANMMDQLVQKDINLITNNDIDIHASGHGWVEDHKLFLNLVNAEYVLPYYMTAFHRYAHKKLALDMGRDEEKILMPNENGQIIEMYENGVKISDEKIKLNTVLIDGKGKWHLSWEYVVQARKIMAHDGVLVVTYKIDTNTKEIVGNIQIESRWFVYSSEVKKVHTLIVDYARSEYNKIVKWLLKSWVKPEDINVKEVLKEIKKKLEVFTEEHIWRVPMIITTFVYINRNPKIPNNEKPVENNEESNEENKN
jgi:ribonuclease J